MGSDNYMYRYTGIFMSAAKHKKCFNDSITLISTKSRTYCDKGVAYDCRHVNISRVWANCNMILVWHNPSVTGVQVKYNHVHVYFSATHIRLPKFIYSFLNRVGASFFRTSDVQYFRSDSWYFIFANIGNWILLVSIYRYPIFQKGWYISLPICHP